MRVHELAKELNIPVKEVIAHLQEAGVDVKSHMSSISEAEADDARVFYGKKPAVKKTAPAPEKREATEGPQAPGEERKPRPKKKKTISAVFNPAYSQNGSRGQKSVVHNAQNAKKRPPQQKPQRPVLPARPVPGQTGAVKPAERSVKPESEEKKIPQTAAPQTAERFAFH